MIEQSAAVLRAFAAERKFLIVTTKAKKPDIQSTVYMEVLKDLQSTMGVVNDIREANRASPLFKHLTTVSEGINLLGWVANENRPVDTITEMLSSAQFWGNKVIQEYKEKYARVTPSQLWLTDSLAEIKHMFNGFRLSTAYSDPLPTTSNSTTRPDLPGTPTVSIHYRQPKK